MCLSYLLFFADRTGLVTAAESKGGGYEWGAGWQRRSGSNFRNPFGDTAAPDEPAVHISWFEAASYCADAGGRLPNKDEWISAAYTEQRPAPTRGLIRGQTYPYPVGDTFDGMNNNRTAHVPVGATSPGVNGLYDMGANVWEWLSVLQPPNPTNESIDQSALCSGKIHTNNCHHFPIDDLMHFNRRPYGRPSFGPHLRCSS